MPFRSDASEEQTLRMQLALMRAMQIVSTRRTSTLINRTCGKRDSSLCSYGFNANQIQLGGYSKVEPEEVEELIKEAKLLEQCRWPSY